MGTKCINLFGEFSRGLSMGLARIGECERGDMCATRLKRCAEMAALLLEEQPAVVSFLVTTAVDVFGVVTGIGGVPADNALPVGWSPAPALTGCEKAEELPCVMREMCPAPCFVVEVATGPVLASAAAVAWPPVTWRFGSRCTRGTTKRGKRGVAINKLLRGCSLERRQVGHV